MTGQVQVRNAELVDLLRADFINCWIPLDQVVLTESMTQVDFANIPQNFRSLIVMGQVATDANAETDDVLLRFDDDTGNNYDWTESTITSAGLVTATTRATSSIRAAKVEGASSRANNYSPLWTHLPGYSRTDCEKWAATFQSGPFGNVSADADVFLAFERGRWRDQQAITKITLLPSAGTVFVPGSRFSLYGIL